VLLRLFDRGSAQNHAAARERSACRVRLRENAPTWTQLKHPAEGPASAADIEASRRRQRVTAVLLVIRATPPAGTLRLAWSLPHVVAGQRGRDAGNRMGADKHQSPCRMARAKLFGLIPLARPRLASVIEVPVDAEWIQDETT
jgi:hypothetical protein